MLTSIPLIFLYDNRDFVCLLTSKNQIELNIFGIWVVVDSKNHTHYPTVHFMPRKQNIMFCICNVRPLNTVTVQGLFISLELAVDKVRKLKWK